MHGRGPNDYIGTGTTHTFVANLQQVLVNKSLTNVYQIVEVGLSDDCNDDMNWSQYKNMTFQLDMFCIYMSQEKITQKLQNSTRIILVGFSQGPLLIRGYLWSNCSDAFRNKIDKMITFGGANNGIWGIPDCNILNSPELSLSSLINITALVNACNNIIKSSNASVLLDCPMYQLLIPYLSFADYWNSPSNFICLCLSSLLCSVPSLRLNTFIAKINNENPSIQSNPIKYMEGLTKGLVMIAFGEDSIMSPCTAFFGYWGLNGDLSCVPYYQTNVYNNKTGNEKDTIGLKALDNNGAIKTATIPNVDHMTVPIQWIIDVFLNLLN